MKDFICIRCGNLKAEGCGLPDYRVMVPYEDGPRMERPACPLVEITRQETICEKVSGFFRALVHWVKHPN